MQTSPCGFREIVLPDGHSGRYATDPDEVAENVRKVIRAGAVGINFEDRLVKGEGLHANSAQTARIRAVKDVAADEGAPLFVNARTDLFLGTDPSSHEGHLAEALEREAAYAQAVADCFFVPGLTDTELISQVTDKASLPVNVMMMGKLTSIKDVASRGVSRASYGPGPFVEFLTNLKRAYTAIEYNKADIGAAAANSRFVSDASVR